MVFEAPRDHGVAAILEAQEWLVENYACSSPVESMVARSDLARRTCERRFKEATFRRLFERLAGTSPGVYRRRFQLPAPETGRPRSSSLRDRRRSAPSASSTHEACRSDGMS